MTVFSVPEDAQIISNITGKGLAKRLENSGKYDMIFVKNITGNEGTL